MKIFYRKEIILGHDYFFHLQNMAIMGEQAVCSGTIQYLKSLKVNLVNSAHVMHNYKFDDLWGGKVKQ